MILKFFRISPLLLFIFLCETLNAQEKTFTIPANKAYAVPYTPDEKEVGVSVPVGYPEDKGSISNWTNKNRSIVWYLYQTAGTYYLDFDNTTAKGKNLTFNLKMSPCYAPLQISPSQTQIVFKGQGRQTRTSAGSILINQTGYYKYELSPQSEPSNAIVIHNLIFKSTTDNAHVNHTDYQSTPSVHINFSSAAATTKSYNWLYEEVNVPQGAARFIPSIWLSVSTEAISACRRIAKQKEECCFQYGTAKMQSMMQRLLNMIMYLL
ncbi:DUF5077 domain-containing protein [Sphingobacterium spiritivorum]|uniref:Emp24/gp25L/p24 family protein n=1 Tax=Sphingobacterium spiritivorum ATCC 33861 TaxID=525373 RepID=D7VL38_SPHSI|nr:DUF5077 domain-containing protein [Sphingobacterium spiritivorum]EFK58311.1 Emp24/gp25L/p24 family protein [Sphingobacterium spiritivorum ATCC 33861]QQT37063.1 DUF5077 domain-containing protein [Sphingobacterium spiritivorum]WQD33835.1 DUF5077 domain-containing protein [Sphingobacterium spiritivorum]